MTCCLIFLPYQPYGVRKNEVFIPCVLFCLSLKWCIFMAQTKSGTSHFEYERRFRLHLEIKSPQLIRNQKKLENWKKLLLGQQ